MKTIITLNDLVVNKTKNITQTISCGYGIKKHLQGLLLFGMLSLFFNPDNIYSQSGNCTSNTPFYSLNLVGNPGGTWTSPSFTRQGQCCGVSNPDRCLEFEVMLDPSAVGLVFSISSGAIPPGAIYYNVNCGPPMAVGTGICLNTPGPHYLTFCKPGNNENTYSITSISAPFVSPDQYASAGCPATVNATGFDATTIIWNDITGNGLYNSYLSCTIACSTVVVTPQAGHPVYADYQICGESAIEGCLDGVIFCDTVRIFFLDDISLSVNPNPGEFCAYESGVSLTGTISNGLPPYTMYWTDNIDGTGLIIDNDNTYFTSIPGTYSFVVQDSRFPTCPQTILNVPVLSHPAPFAAISPTNVSCYGDSTGSATTIVNTGTPPFNYLWNDPDAQTNSTATNLAPGTYSVSVTDANGCSTTATTTITQPAGALNAAVTAQTNVLCFGNATGTATVTANAGTPPYTYVWNTSPAQTAATATGLLAGNYTVTVTDANGCSTTAATTITQPAGALIATITSQTNVLCFGNATGAATVTANAGTPPYTYAWNTSPAQTAATASGLAAGSYTVTVTDANGCSTTLTTSITQPAGALIAVITSQTNVLCFGNATGSATVTANAGTPPYAYAWSTSPAQTGATASGLAAGSYTVTVTDANGCSTTAATVITQPAGALIAAITAQTNVLCFGNATGA
ncbi:MAG TPA: SprB repeat-containing protein, partial [Bacteroidales bacterium]|nr:SprB repeat-containing protein [Bacteroidales bacterium]